MNDNGMSSMGYLMRLMNAHAAALIIGVFSLPALGAPVESFREGGATLTSKAKTPLTAPVIKLQSFKIIGVDFAAAHTQLTLVVENTSEREIIVTAVDYKLTVKAVTIEGRVTQREKFLPKVRRTVTVPIALPFSSASATIMEIITAPEANIPYVIQGDIVVEGESAPFHFEHRGRVIT